MNRQTLADVLQSTNQTGSYTLATVLEGAEAGSQLLLRDGDALWQTQSAELLQRQLAVLQACTATGFLTLEGQRVFAERFGAVPQLVVCGGGHVAAALVKQAKLLGIPVLAIDDREEFAQQYQSLETLTSSPTHSASKASWIPVRQCLPPKHSPARLQLHFSWIQQSTHISLPLECCFA